MHAHVTCRNRLTRLFLCCKQVAYRLSNNLRMLLGDCSAENIYTIQANNEALEIQTKKNRHLIIDSKAKHT